MSEPIPFKDLPPPAPPEWVVTATITTKVRCPNSQIAEQIMMDGISLNLPIATSGAQINIVAQAASNLIVASAVHDPKKHN